MCSLWCKFGALFFLTLLCIGEGSTATPATPDCALEGIEDKEWSNYTLREIEDDAKPNTEILKIKTEKIEEISIDPNDVYKYVDVSITENNKTKYFEVKLTEEFPHYEENEISDIYNFKVLFRCSKGARMLNLNLPIKDTNNHAPEFIEGPYEFTLPMPLPKNFDFSSLGQERIIARDVDLTTENIKFTVVNAKEFVIENSGSDKLKKEYYAVLKTSDVVNLEEDFIFQINATDVWKGNYPQKFTVTNVTIKVDKENSIPQFNHSVYIADYRKVNSNSINATIIEFEQGPVTLTRGFSKEVQYELQVNPEAYKANFNITPSKDNKSIKVQKNLNIKEVMKTEHVITLTVIARKSAASDSTTLLIYLPEPPKDTVPEPNYDGYITAVVLLTLLFAGSAGAAVYFYMRIRNMTSTYP